MGKNRLIKNDEGGVQCMNLNASTREGRAPRGGGLGKGGACPSGTYRGPREGGLGAPGRCGDPCEMRDAEKWRNFLQKWVQSLRHASQFSLAAKENHRTVSS